MNASNIDAIRQQLKIWRQNLANFEVEEAKYAGHAPPVLANDIVEARQQIKQLEDALDAASAGNEPVTLIAGYNSIFALFERTSRTVDDINRRVKLHDEQIGDLHRRINPTPQEQVARTVSSGLIILYISVWLIAESRQWLLAYPTNAVLMGIAIVGMAGLIYWLPGRKP